LVINVIYINKPPKGSLLGQFYLAIRKGLLPEADKFLRPPECSTRAWLSTSENQALGERTGTSLEQFRPYVSNIMPITARTDAMSFIGNRSLSLRKIAAKITIRIEYVGVSDAIWAAFRPIWYAP
jgi:hypothetical protein